MLRRLGGGDWGLLAGALPESDDEIDNEDPALLIEKELLVVGSDLDSSYHCDVVADLVAVFFLFDCMPKIACNT